ELERIRSPHLEQKARAQRPAQRAARMIGPHGHEERRADTQTTEQLEQARDALVETAACVDIDAQADGRAFGGLDHSRVPTRTARRTAHRSAGSATSPAACTRVSSSEPSPVRS